MLSKKIQEYGGVIGLFFLMVISVQGDSSTSKVALVQFQKVFQSLPVTEAAQNQIRNERSKLQKDDAKNVDAILAVDKVINELLVRQQSEAISEEERKKLHAEFLNQFRLRQEKDAARKQALERLNLQLNDKMMARMKTILAKLHQQVQQFAKEEGYTLVFDTSGLNTSHVPSVLYVKGATDITEDLILHFKAQK